MNHGDTEDTEESSRRKAEGGMMNEERAWLGAVGSFGLCELCALRLDLRVGA